MAQSSFPFQAVDTTETQFSQWARHITSNGRSGVAGVPSGTDLKVTANSSGMQVFVAAGQAIVRGHYYVSTAAETVSIGPANTNPRIDSIVLKLDPALNSIVLQVVAGTAAASPVAPTLTQTDAAIFQFKLADVRVEASTTTIDSSKVTDTRQFIRDVWTSSTRPSGAEGLIGYNTTTSKVEFFNGTAWADITAALDASSITTGTFNVDRIPSLNANKITSGTIDAGVLPTIGVAKGGTGATDASTARSNLGVAAANHTHQIIDVAGLGSELASKASVGHGHLASGITDPENLYAGRIRAGGTAGGNPTRIYVQSTQPTGMSAGDLWFW